jgi:hypothetical protein
MKRVVVTIERLYIRSRQNYLDNEGVNFDIKKISQFFMHGKLLSALFCACDTQYEYEGVLTSQIKSL